MALRRVVSSSRKRSRNWIRAQKGDDALAVNHFVTPLWDIPIKPTSRPISHRPIALRKTKGAAVYNKPDGTIAWDFTEELKTEQQKAEKRGAEWKEPNNPYDQEHIDLVTSIRTSEPVNEAVATAESTMVGIMGRISAYTGSETTWQEMMDSDLRLGPTEYAMGPVDLKPLIPVPGKDKS